MAIRALAQRMIARAGLRVKDAQTPDGDIEIVVTGPRQGENLFEQPFTGGTFTATVHPKILCAEVPLLPPGEIALLLQAIRDLAATGDNAAALAIARRALAGFVAPVKLVVDNGGPIRRG